MGQSLSVPFLHPLLLSQGQQRIEEIDGLNNLSLSVPFLQPLLPSERQQRIKETSGLKSSKKSVPFLHPLLTPHTPTSPLSNLGSR
jgi:hypothetical protein